MQFIVSRKQYVDVYEFDTVAEVGIFMLGKNMKEWSIYIRCPLTEKGRDIGQIKKDLLRMQESIGSLPADRS